MTHWLLSSLYKLSVVNSHCLVLLEMERFDSFFKIFLPFFDLLMARIEVSSSFCVFFVRLMTVEVAVVLYINHSY